MCNGPPLPVGLRPSYLTAPTSPTHTPAPPLPDAPHPTLCPSAPPAAGLLGERVAIVGLSESLGLNGHWGYAISWAADKQRYVVKLPSKLPSTDDGFEERSTAAASTLTPNPNPQPQPQPQLYP